MKRNLLSSVTLDTKKVISFFFLFVCFVLLSCITYGQNTVPSSLFGIGLNSISPNGNVQPNPWCPQDSNHNVVPVTSLRLWDDAMKWSQIETAASSPTNGTYVWTKFDYALSSTIMSNPACPVQILYQFGSTPAFAARAGSATTCSPPDTTNSCKPPADLNGDGTGDDAWWLNFVGNVANRAVNVDGVTGMEWGLWNEADSPNYWCWNGAGCGGGTNPALAANTVAYKNLVLMGWDARNEILCFDPTAKFISIDGHVGTMTTQISNYINTTINAPARNITVAGHNCSWSAQTVTGLNTFERTKGDVTTAILSEHMRGQGSCNTTNGTSNCDPTSVIAAMTAMNNEIAQDSLTGITVYNDEHGYNQGQCPNVAACAAYTGIQYLLMGTYSSPRITQANWYLWDANQFPLSQTLGGLAYHTVQNWTVGSTLNSTTNVGTIYSITGTLHGTGASIKFMFDKSQTCTGTTFTTCPTTNQSAGAFTNYQTLDGVSHTVSGGVVPVGYPPIMLTGSAATPAASPTYSPVATDFGDTFPQSITISTTSGGAIICYTTNGTTPATNGSTGCTTGTKYTSPVSISVNTSFNAVAGGSGFTDSTVATSAYTFTGSVGFFNPFGGTYVGSQNVTLNFPDSTTACITNDGTTPASNGAGACTGTAFLYSGAINVASSKTLKATSIKSGWNDGSTRSSIYTIQYSLSTIIVGQGTVTSSPTGISCGSTCSGIFNQGTVVTLTAFAGSGYTFTGWSGGGCAGTAPCAVTLNTTTSVTATFTANSQSTINRAPAMN